MRTAKTPADKYVASVRNAEKKNYAARYLAWLRGGQVGEAPSRSSSLSFMAAQGVRLELGDHLRANTL